MYGGLFLGENYCSPIQVAGGIVIGVNGNVEPWLENLTEFPRHRRISKKGEGGRAAYSKLIHTPVFLWRSNL